ncbi:MAG: hypothetical protein KGL10_01910 [Alphaproteobacteria bacterium]|nr:hypothetical protein [Alphaproteobacteria bacterium]MDE2336043.1 hypothetical protein [Alphaproteobacteria bacterium]
MPDGIIIAKNSILVEVQTGLKQAIKKTGGAQGKGVELAELARELRKCEKAIAEQDFTGIVGAQSPLLAETQQTLLLAFNAAAGNDNAALIALSKELRHYEKIINKPAKSASKPAP